MTLAFIIWVAQGLILCAAAAVGMVVVILACWAVVFCIGYAIYLVFKGLFA